MYRQTLILIEGQQNIHCTYTQYMLTVFSSQWGKHLLLEREQTSSLYQASGGPRILVPAVRQHFHYGVLQQSICNTSAKWYSSFRLGLPNISWGCGMGGLCIPSGSHTIGSTSSKWLLERHTPLGANRLLPFPRPSRPTANDQKYKNL